MDQLKHFIDTHRDAFEDDRLPAGHLERFEKKLPASYTRNKLLYSMYTLVAAASIALLFVFHPFSPKEETDSFSHVEQAFANLSQEDQAYMLAVYQEDIFMNE